MTRVRAMFIAAIVCAGTAGLALVASTPGRAANAAHPSYTTSQAYRGRLQYYESCAECHGGKLQGQFGPALAGADDNLKYQSVKDIYTYFSTHMPHGNPESLSQDQYVAIMAFIMQAHAIAAGSRPLTAAAIARDAADLGDGR